MNVLIAMANEQVAEAFSKHIKEREHHVPEVCVSIEDLIEYLMNEEKGKLNPPDAILMSSDIAQKMEDRRLEFLSNCLLTIREVFPNVQFIILATEKVGHPFLSELVSIGIYNIFLTTTKKYKVAELLDSIKTPKTFTDVKELREIDTSIPWRNPHSQQQPQKIEIATRYEKSTKQSEKRNDINPEKKQIKVDNGKEDFLSLIDEEDLLFEIPVKEKIIVQQRLVGAVFIGVVGVEANTGSTHTSLLLANFLNNRGLNVALIEANNSNHLFEIEYVYEGGKGFTSTQNHFNIKGIDHYKGINQLNISDLIHQYDFIILDIGWNDNTDYFEEFFRSHLKIVTAHGTEWKRKNLLSFLKTFEEHEQDNWILAIPFIDSRTLGDVEKDTKLTTFSIPTQSDPYSNNKEIAMVFEDMLNKYLPTKKAEKPSTNVFVASGIAILIISFVVMAITFF